MRALVTGGGGFLGLAVARGLLERGFEVRSLSRGDYPVLAELGIDQYRGDLADRECVTRAVAGCGIVYHVAAKAGVWGDEQDYYSCNVVGTQNVIDACLRAGVQRLVYTSTPSVVHGGDDVAGVDESAPYPERFSAAYPRTKAEAERRVLAANGDALATVALRPHLIWGPGDNHLVPQIVARRKSGRLRLVDRGRALVDSVFVDNAADAHLLAGERIAPGAACAGKAYFISQGAPTTTAELINGLLGAAGLEPVTANISPRVAYLVGFICEAVYRGFRLAGEPPMTRFLARQLATAHWYDISAARRDLDYAPVVSFEDGMARLSQWFRDGKPAVGSA